MGTRLWAALLTLLIECVLVLAILSLGIAQSEVSKPKGSSLVSVTFAPAEQEPSPQTAPARKQRPDLSQPNPSQPAAPRQLAPNPAPSQPQPPPLIPIARGPPGGFDLANLPRAVTGPPSGKSAMGPPDRGVPGDSRRVGSAPNGEPLYAAAWFREPYDSELRGYLSTADGPGWALIACRTVPEFRVDDCVALDEYPSGSNMARAVLAAAWQFKVRPPRLGGVSKVGEWVRIRVDYTLSPG